MYRRLQRFPDRWLTLYSAAILPASLENLFPEYDEIPSEDVPEYYESLDNDVTDNSAVPGAADDDPDYVPFGKEPAVLFGRA